MFTIHSTASVTPPSTGLKTISRASSSASPSTVRSTERKPIAPPSSGVQTLTAVVVRPSPCDAGTLDEPGILGTHPNAFGSAAPGKERPRRNSVSQWVPADDVG